MTGTVSARIAKAALELDAADSHCQLGGFLGLLGEGSRTARWGANVCS
jgi:hypothetical protein